MNVFPTSFNPCILRCAVKNGNNVVTLYMESSRDTKFMEIGFTNKFFEGGHETIFRCDLMDARDGGQPFLCMYDVIARGNEPLPLSQAARIALIDSIINDEELLSQQNEVRIIAPDLFAVSEISDVFEFILPNYRALALGVTFTSVAEKPPKELHSGSTTDRDFIIQRTEFPEVYELYVQGVTSTPGNNIAYIPNLQTAQYVKQKLKGRTSVEMSFTFNKERQKWAPKIS